MFKKFCIILLIIFLSVLSAFSLGEFYFSSTSNEHNYFFLIISIIFFCFSSALFWTQLRKSN